MRIWLLDKRYQSLSDSRGVELHRSRRATEMSDSSCHSYGFVHALTGRHLYHSPMVPFEREKLMFSRGEIETIGLGGVGQS